MGSFIRIFPKKTRGDEPESRFTQLVNFEARVLLTGVEKSVQLAGSMQVVGDHLQKGKKKAPRDAALDWDPSRETGMCSFFQQDSGCRTPVQPGI